MIYLVYNINNYNFLLKLSNIYDKFEIRQDFCKFSKNKLKTIFNKLPNSIYTYKAEFKTSFKNIKIGLDSGAKIIDFDYEWGEKNFEICKNYIIKNSYEIKLILSWHIDIKNFNFNQSDLIFNKLLSYKPFILKLVIEEINSYNELNLYKKLLRYVNNKITILGSGKFGKEARIESLIRKVPIFYVTLNNFNKINESILSLSELLNLYYEF